MQEDKEAEKEHAEKSEKKPKKDDDIICVFRIKNKKYFISKFKQNV